MTRPDETEFMRRAIALARKSLGHTRPNPAVGAVVVRGGRVIGEGRHVRCGLDHAEAAAMKSASRRGNALKGSTVYCTLEPCSRPGRVGACCDALAAAGVLRVVWACPDPNPKNANRAKRVLGKAGIRTECWKGSHDPAKRACAEEAAEIVAPFAKFVTEGIPFVTVKVAMSLDGRICDDSGDAKWISSDASRRETGRMRETVDAIMVGAETVRKDNPSLLSHGRDNPDLVRVVVTRSGDLPRRAQVFTDAARRRTVVLCVGRMTVPEKLAWCSRPDGIGAVVACRTLRDGMAVLGRLMNTMHVLCEGGLELARSLAADGLVDEWLTVLAPKVIGHGRVSKAASAGIVRAKTRHVGADVFVASRFEKPAR